MINIDLIRNKVRLLLDGDNTGHGFEHVERVSAMAVRLALQEGADTEITQLAALLHDVDDYKLFGMEYAEKLINAREIMNSANVAPEKQEVICEIIKSMGYNKALKGIRPQSLEGKVVSDADMLDAIGAIGTIRCLAYALARCSTPIFAPDVWPQINMSADEYRCSNRHSDNFINHFFEKLLKLKDMMLTESARKEALKRHEFMVIFLHHFFEEQECDEWLEYMRRYEEINKIAA